MQKTPQFLLKIAKKYFEFTEFGVLHNYLCQRICEPRQQYIRLFLLPRGFFKTSLFTYVDSVADALVDPNTRILICSGVLANAKAMVTKMGKLFTHNEDFRLAYPEYCPENPENPNTKWTESCITLPNRTKHHAEGTFEAMGADSTIVSRHYDKMKFDDLVTDENSTTKEQLEKVIKFFEQCKALSDRREKTPVDVYGTTWDDGDLYAYLQKQHNVEIVKIPALYGDDTIGIKFPHFNYGESVFPEEYPTEKIQSFEKDDPHTYAMFYKLDPVPMGDRTFKDFTFYDKLPDEDDEDVVLRKFMTVDPAPTQNPTSAYSAITIVGTDKNNIYVIETWRNKVNPQALIDKIWQLYFGYKCECIGIESDVYQVALKYWLQERIVNNPEHKYMKITELKARGKRKEDRIAALQPYVNTGKIKFKESQKDLIWELSRFPKASTRDLADALAYQLYLVKPSTYSQKEEIPANSLEAWKRRSKIGKYRRKEITSLYVGNP